MGVLDFFDDLLDTAGDIGDSVWNETKHLWDSTSQAISDSWDNVTGGVGDFFDGVKDVGSGIISGVEDAGKWAGGVIKDVYDDVKEGGKNLLDLPSNVAGSLTLPLLILAAGAGIYFLSDSGYGKRRLR